MPDKTVRDIITDYLRDNGFDGLYNDDLECGCSINDLVPCDSACDMCRPGYRVETPGQDFNFSIVGEKPV